MSEKRVIKAREVQEGAVNVEKVDYEIRKFGEKVYKHVPLDEEAVAMEDQADLPEPEYNDNNPEQDAEEEQVQLERFYGEDGELSGLKITCRCGEVIELEFTRDEDQMLAEQPQQPAEEKIVDATEQKQEDQTAPEN